MSKKVNHAVLYHHPVSGPSRMALLAVRNLGLDVEIRFLDIYKGEQNTPEFLKINPLHQVPVLVHDSFVLTESRAIMMYLASLADSPLYPQGDLQKRALVDSRLFYDATSCFETVRNFARPVIRAGAKKIPNTTREAIMAALSTLESLLGSSKWFAGEDMTLADLAFLSSVDAIKTWGVNLKEFPKLDAWYEQCKALPGFAENHEGSQMLADKLTKLLEEPLWK